MSRPDTHPASYMGRRLQTFWPDVMEWYSGAVTCVQECKPQFKVLVTYDDGDFEWGDFAQGGGAFLLEEGDKRPVLWLEDAKDNGGGGGEEEEEEGAAQKTNKPAKKRGRPPGRPRKHPRPEDLQQQQQQQQQPAPPAAPEPAKKRGRPPGRPRKHPRPDEPRPKAGSTQAPPRKEQRRGPGRPKKPPLPAEASVSEQMLASFAWVEDAEEPRKDGNGEAAAAALGPPQQQQTTEARGTEAIDWQAEAAAALKCREILGVELERPQRGAKSQARESMRQQLADERTEAEEPLSHGSPRPAPAGGEAAGGVENADADQDEDEDEERPIAALLAPRTASGSAGGRPEAAPAAAKKRAREAPLPPPLNNPGKKSKPGAQGGGEEGDINSAAEILSSLAKGEAEAPPPRVSPAALGNGDAAAPAAEPPAQEERTPIQSAAKQEEEEERARKPGEHPAKAPVSPLRQGSRKLKTSCKSTRAAEAARSKGGEAIDAAAAAPAQNGGGICSIKGSASKPQAPEFPPEPQATKVPLEPQAPEDPPEPQATKVPLEPQAPEDPPEPQATKVPLEPQVPEDPPKPQASKTLPGSASNRQYEAPGRRSPSSAAASSKAAPTKTPAPAARLPAAKQPQKADAKKAGPSQAPAAPAAPTSAVKSPVSAAVKPFFSFFGAAPSSVSAVAPNITKIGKGGLAAKVAEKDAQKSLREASAGKGERRKSHKEAAKKKKPAAQQQTPKPAKPPGPEPEAPSSGVQPQRRNSGPAQGRALSGGSGPQKKQGLVVEAPPRSESLAAALAAADAAAAAAVAAASAVRRGSGGGAAEPETPRGRAEGEEEAGDGSASEPRSGSVGAGARSSDAGAGAGDGDGGSSGLASAAAPREEVEDDPDKTVARCAALEGLLEGLSRTKESISAATGVMLPGARHGAAGALVRTVLARMEAEPSLTKRIDLFYLLDSVVQRSVKPPKEGRAGDGAPRTGPQTAAARCFPPAVAANLRRLVKATATASSDGEAKVDKVLKLWRQRGIMDEKFVMLGLEQLGKVKRANEEALNAAKRPKSEERQPRRRNVPQSVVVAQQLGVDEYGSIVPLLLKANPPNSSRPPLTLTQVLKKGGWMTIPEMPQEHSWHLLDHWVDGLYGPDREEARERREALQARALQEANAVEKRKAAAARLAKFKESAEKRRAEKSNATYESSSKAADAMSPDKPQLQPPPPPSNQPLDDPLAPLNPAWETPPGQPPPPPPPPDDGEDDDDDDMEDDMDSADAPPPESCGGRYSPAGYSPLGCTPAKSDCGGYEPLT